MEIIGVSRNLLVFISVLSLASASTPQPTTTANSTAAAPANTTTAFPTHVNTTRTTTAKTSTAVSGTQWPAIFYQFGPDVGDVQTFGSGYPGEKKASVNLASPFVYFGRTYNLIYVNSYGVLSFNQSISKEISYNIPTYGSVDLIAPLWADIDAYVFVVFYYHEYTSGNVLTRATEDIKRYYPGLSFNATWVFVATWGFSTLLTNSSIPFQAVLISDGVSSFILMNYGDMSVINYPVVAGYDTIGSINYFVIPGSNDGSLNSTSNVNTPGRWVFSLNKENVVGLQMKVTSMLDLTDNGNLAFVMQKLNDELVNRGMPSYVQVTARRVQKAP
ncbi:sushi, nidogen and EGF-like domain-containing protein 1 [Paramisgurnus dabryanus]|uniref:sushi, nidogen and EGF-like domain-containing protein 1 n=1 Tax=Paramisgurnus dabryanus TaxID=90735 RepID=UPI0031F3D78D